MRGTIPGGESEKKEKTLETISLSGRPDPNKKARGRMKKLMGQSSW